MGLTLRQLTRAVWLLVAVLLVAAAVDASQWWRQSRWNDTIASGVRVPDEPVPQLRFARAYAEAARGDPELALKAYRALHADPALGAAARFNSANLLMRQALRVRSGPQPGQAIPLIELAKEGLRELLRQDPQHWDARYNLERAQRLLPDPSQEEMEPAAASPERERAATTMRAQSRGLP